MEPKKTPRSQTNVEKENQSCSHPNSGLQAALKSCNHENSMVLAQKRQMDQWHGIENPETNLQRGRKEYPVEKRLSVQQMVLGKLDSDM